ncbi:MAG: hypothetical protein KAR32_09325, partial [Candidatus Omnitrophica bacterium]|nr:hypothetical protein [Candidatus Omnitrophota bacterium]
MMKIGEVFKNAGLISPDALETALKEQETSHDRLGDIMLRNGMVTHEQMAPVLAEYFGTEHINLSEIYKDIEAGIIDTVSIELARRFNLIPVSIKDQTLTVATFDPLDLLAIDTLRIKTGYKIRCVVAVEDEIKEAVEYCYNNLPRMKEHIDNFIELEVKDQDHLKDESGSVQCGVDDQPVVQYVKSLIVQAVNNRASDILLQPKQDKAELRMRIDGILYYQDPPPKAMLSAISARIKIISGLDIAEKRLP